MALFGVDRVDRSWKAAVAQIQKLDSAHLGGIVAGSGNGYGAGGHDGLERIGWHGASFSEKGLVTDRFGRTPKKCAKALHHEGHEENQIGRRLTLMTQIKLMVKPKRPHKTAYSWLCVSVVCCSDGPNSSILTYLRVLRGENGFLILICENPCSSVSHYKPLCV
jgi:hypothetical protein